MKLRIVCPYLNVDDYEQELRSKFLFRSRYVSNFVSRRIRGLGGLTSPVASDCAVAQGPESCQSTPRLKSQPSTAAPWRSESRFMLS